MAERSVVVRLAASVSSYVSSMGQAKKATDDVATAAEKSGQKQGQSAKQAASAAAGIAAALGKEAQAAQDAAKAHDLHYNSSGKLVDANNKFVSSSAAAEAGLSTFSKTVKDAAAASDVAADAAARASGPIKRLGATLDEVATSAKNNRAAWDQAGGALTTFGAVAVAGLGFAAKAAMDWESSWAGVTKTIDGTPEQMAALETGIRGLATSLPLAHTEIAAVAEAAGQLGVARDDVLGFTKTMIDLGESTNLTADEAATQIAQISNVMGTMGREGAEGVSRFGATLVELGNNGASTEADILAMSQRIAGAMATVGGSEVELLALANALASMGVKAELGGGTMTRVLTGIYSSIQDGGPKLEAFAKTAGVSAAEFAAAFEASPVTALSLVATGLGRVKDEGGNVVGALKDMGIKGTESTQVMLALASSGTLLEDSLAQGNVAWKENTALLEEANKRYATTESQVKVAWNGIKDAAIDAGAVVLPVIQNVAEAVADMAETWGNLPAPVQGAITGLTGVVGVAALAAGGLLLVVPRALDTVNAFKSLADSSPRAASGLSKVAKAAGGALAIAGVGIAIAKISEASYMDKIDTGMGRVALALTKVANESPDATAALDGLFKNRDGDALTEDITNLESAISRTFNPGAEDKFNDWAQPIVTAITGVEGSVAILDDAWTRVDQGLSDLVGSGDMDGAAATFKKLEDQMIAQGATTEEVAAMFPQYADAVAAAAAEQEGAAAGAEETAAALEIQAAAAEEAAAVSEKMAEALAEIGLSAEGAITDIVKFSEVLVAAGLSELSARDASAAHQEAIDNIAGSYASATEALAQQLEMEGMSAESAAAVAKEQVNLGVALNDTATDFDLANAAGRAMNDSFQAVVSTGLAEVEAKAKAGVGLPELQENLRSTYDSAIIAAEGMGITGENAVNLARVALGVPDNINIDTWLSDYAVQKAQELTGTVEAVPDMVQIDTWMSEAAKLTGEATKKSAEDIPNQETIDTWMSDAAFQEALRTRAASLGIPEQEVIDSFMSSAARNEADNTTASVLGVPPGVSISSFMDNYAQIVANNIAAAVNNIPTNKVITITTRNETVGVGQVGLNAKGGRIPKHELGGRLPGHAGGYRLPTTGPGTDVTDGILGISSKTGAPVSWLDGGEQITSARMTDKHSDLLWAIHRDDPRLSAIPALAGGGRPTSREYAPAMAYVGSTGSEMAAAVAASLPTHAMVPVRLTIDGRKLHEQTVRAAIEYN